jgi:hypothetical protein
MNTYEFGTFLMGILLRIAVPVGVTAFVVGLLRYLDALWQAEAMRKAMKVGGAMIPIQNLKCWDIHECPPERKAKCPAYLNPNIPCWQAHCVHGQLQEACRACPFRKMKLAVKPVH